MAGIIRQYYQASGEASPQAQLPEKFISPVQPASPLASHQQIAPADFQDPRTTPVVTRIPRMTGFRTIYSRGMTAMPVRNLGGDGPAFPWDSGFQKNMEGPIRNAHFNDALFQAGYPGYNLGLSFKVQTLPTTNSGTRSSRETPGLHDITRHVPLLRRSKGT